VTIPPSQAKRTAPVEQTLVLCASLCHNQVFYEDELIMNYMTAAGESLSKHKQIRPKRKNAELVMGVAKRPFTVLNPVSLASPAAAANLLGNYIFSIRCFVIYSHII